MKENTHREPTLFIVGNKERKDEIRHIIEDEWGGNNDRTYKYDNEGLAYYINTFGYVSFVRIEQWYKEVIKGGWMKEYKLPEKPQFKPFDKVVVRDYSGLWRVDFFSHIDKDSPDFPFACTVNNYDKCLPYNEQTAKLIGTNDEWKGGDNE